ncbi:MAG: HAD family phosphatase [Bulleidia sp.]|nr:HAD family phosphatase [Bulleidia sp.]
MITAVLFDMDGILYDSEAWYMKGSIETMKELGYTGDMQALNKALGLTVNEMYRYFRSLLNNKVSVKRIAEVNDAYYAEHPLPPYQEIMFPHVPEVLKGLKQDGYLLACCSSSPLDTIRESLEAMGILGYFDFMESGENVKHSKPDPEIYLQAASHLKVKPSECIVYEDSRTGIESGKRAGMTVIARRDERFKQDISEADHAVNDVMEMAAMVREINTCRK